MLGFIDCGILAKEIMMLFPEEDNITPDIYSAIKSLSLIILGTDSNPSTSSQKNFCRTLRNIVEELFKLQHGESEDIIDADSLRKLEDLAQQAINWRVNFNNKNPCQTAPTVEDHACQSDDIPGSSKETATDMPVPGRPPKPSDWAWLQAHSGYVTCAMSRAWGTQGTADLLTQLGHPTTRHVSTRFRKKYVQWSSESPVLMQSSRALVDRLFPGSIPLTTATRLRAAMELAQLDRSPIHEQGSGEQGSGEQGSGELAMVRLVTGLYPANCREFLLSKDNVSAFCCALLKQWGWCDERHVKEKQFQAILLSVRSKKLEDLSREQIVRIFQHGFL